MSEEEKKAIDNLRFNTTNNGFSLYDGTTNIFRLRDIQTILNLIEKQEKVIDEMAEHILLHSNSLAKYFCEGVKENVCESRGSTIQGCNYCIKQYFYRKVEEDG